MSALTITHPTRLSKTETTLAVRSGNEIAHFAKESANASMRLTIQREDGESMEVTIPAVAVQVLAKVLQEISKGNAVTLVPENAELSTNEAADLLSISRPFLIKNFLDRGIVPCRRVGNHRRIRYADILTYLEEERKNGEKILTELMAYSEEIGLYDLED
jgi:excisionase family DNA binding protein